MAQSREQQIAMFAKAKQISKSIGDRSQKEVPELYHQLEEKNRQVPKPTQIRVGTVFRDDPNAIQKQEQKVKNFENEQDYWKLIVKEPQRTFGNAGNTLGDARWWALTNTSTNLREAKKKLDKLKSDKEKGIKLTRQPTFIEGKKRFFFKEEMVNEN